MRKEPEGGGFGSGILRSYTLIPSLIAITWLGTLVRKDLGDGGERLLSVALGIESEGWLRACVYIGPWIAVGVAKGVVLELYRQYTGYIYFEDRIGFAKSGGEDIGFWCGLLPFVGFVYLFAYVIDPGLGFLRAVLIVIGSSVLGRLTASSLARRVFSALYGPPVFV